MCPRRTTIAGALIAVSLLVILWPPTGRFPPTPALLPQADVKGEMSVEARHEQSVEPRHEHTDGGESSQGNNGVNTSEDSEAVVAPLHIDTVGDDSAVFVVELQSFDDVEHDEDHLALRALPVSSPLLSVTVHGESLWAKQKHLVEETQAAGRAKVVDDSAIVVRPNAFDWAVSASVRSLTESEGCLVTVHLTRDRKESTDRYRTMVQESLSWQRFVKDELGPDAFRVVARSNASVHMGAVAFEQQPGVTAEQWFGKQKYLGIVHLPRAGTFDVSISHLHTQFGAFADTDRRGSYCPLPKVNLKLKKPAVFVDYNNRVESGRDLATVSVTCLGRRVKDEKKPLCDHRLRSIDFLQGWYEKASVSSRTGRRNFRVVGEDLRWVSRKCNVIPYSSEERVGQLYNLFLKHPRRVLFLGDSQIRTFVNAFLATLFNKPADVNNRGEYSKRAFVPSNSSSGAVSSFQFLWDPQGILSSYLRLVANDVYPGGAFFGVNRASPEYKTIALLYSYWRQQRPDVVVMSFSGWNAWLCETFAQAERRVRRTASAVEFLTSQGVTVVFLGWPSPIDSLEVVQSKKRITSSRVGLLTEMTRLELIAAGAFVLPFFELSFPMTDLSSKASASHFDDSIVLYSLVDFLGTILTS